MNKFAHGVLVCLVAMFSLPAVSGIQLDTSFGDGGYVQTNISTFDDSNQQTRSVLVQADGKVVVAGIDNNGNDNDFALIRYNTDGTRDLGFGEGGQVSTDLGSADELYDLVQQADGKIVAVGFTFNSNNDIVLLRFNTDGSLDDTFGTAGQVTTDTGVYELAYSIISQADGMLVVGGVVDNYLTLIRYSEDGVLDTSFGDQGFAILRDDLDTYDRAQARDVIQQADGKLVTVGRNYIVRFNVNGTLDTSFDTDGVNTVPASFSQILAVAQQTDGGFLATGPTTGGDIAVARFLITGALDTDFGTAGVVTTDLGGSTDTARAILADDTDDRFVITGGGADGVDNQEVLLRYNADGSPDTTFSGDGKVETIVGDTTNLGIADAQQTDSQYVVAAWAIHPTDQDFATLRYDNDGILDAGFNTSGIKVDHIGHNTKDTGWALHMQSDGKLIAGGSAALSTLGSDLNTPTDFAMVGYLANGSLDTGFADGGRVVDSIMSPYSNIRGLIEQTDGKIVSLVGTWDGAASGMALIRYDISGGRDTSFGSEGTGVVSLAHSAYIGFQQSDGKLVVANRDHLQRYDLSGNPDNSFGNAGVVTPAACGCSGDSVVEQASGKLVVAGVNGVERYLDNGTLDVSFAVAGKLSLPENIGTPWLVQQPVDGQLIVASLPVSDDPTLTIMRFSVDGELDTTFGELGTTTTLVNDINGTNHIHKLVLQDDGKLVVFVRTDSFDLKLLRYNIAGLLDTGFGDNGIYLLPFEARNEGGTLIVGDLVYESGTFTTFVSKNNDFFMARFIDETGAAPVAESPVANNVTQGNAGDSSYSFSIRYTDVDGDLDYSSIGTTNVTACNGETCGVIYGYPGIGSQSDLNVGYQMTPPGGSWDEADNGTYTISILANEVADDELNYVAADANAGSFTVSIVDPTQPGAPVIVSGTPANTGALIAFTPPVDDGGAAIIDYTAVCNGGADAVGTSSPLLVTGLTNGVTFECYVYARNSVGTGTLSGSVMVTPTDGGDVTLPPAGEGPGEVVTFTHTATSPSGGAPVSATLEVVATDPTPPDPPPAEAESLVAAVDISSTGSVAGYTMVVIFEIDPASMNVFTGFWKYGKEAPADTPHWYDYGLKDEYAPGTGFEISADRKTLTVYFTDGQRGDDDLTINASIVDPALPIIQIDPLIFKDDFE